VRAGATADALSELAHHFGVLEHYEGAGGIRIGADPEAVAAALALLGAPLAGPGDAPEALRAVRADRRPALVDPVLVHRTDAPAPLALSLPRGWDPGRARLTVELEDGTAWSCALERARRRPAPDPDRCALDHYELDLGAGGGVAPGYHRVRLEAGGEEAQALLIAAPACPRPGRGWGAFVALPSLRTGPDWGVGSYPDLGRLLEWIGGFGGSLAGTLPLHPLHEGGDLDPSPYRPLSRLALSEAYVDPRVVPELEIAPDARDRLGSPALLAELEAMRRATLVDHAAVLRAVRSVLAPMAAALHDTSSPRRAELEAFARERPDLVAYAAFRAGPDSEGAPADAGDTAGHTAGDTAGGPLGAWYHLYAQWVAEEQLAAAGRAGSLYLDLPLGVHPAGFDPQWEPGAFVAGAEVGAPPDAFFAGGQRWGFPPLHPHRLRAQGYRHLVDVLRQAMRHAAVLRIDHVMGLYRLYWIPEGFDPAHGVYVRYPAPELRAVVCLEAHRAGVAVVGEDLGTVPASVREGMAEDHVLRSWVVQFESSATAPLPDPPEDALASWGTHDLPRLAGYWDGADLDEREADGELTPATADAARAGRAAWREAFGAAGVRGAADAVRVVLGHLAAGPARLVMVDLEDLWGERRPHNRPGTGAAAGNWMRRATRTLAEAAADPSVRALLAEVDAGRREHTGPVVDEVAR
jgi:4-alpha-glucanotransferase